MFIEKRKQLSSLDILGAYKSGRRDFSDIICMGADFPKAQLSGCSFRNSNLSFCAFDDADLSGCDFTGANLEWSSFKRADLRRSDFTKANISWSVLNKAKVEKTIFRNANVTWCLLFDVDIEKADKKTADFTMSAFHPHEVMKEGRLAVMKELAAKKNLLPFELYFELECIVKTGTENIEKIVNIAEEKKNPYEISAGFGYGSAGKSAYGGISVSAPAENYGVGVGGSYGIRTKAVSDYGLGVD